MPYTSPEKRRVGRRASYRKRKAKILIQERGYRAAKPAAYRNTQLKRRYGITLDQFDVMLKNQNGLCALCETKPAVDVDHCHDTGKIRGLLCRGCNVGLGQLGDNLDGLLRAVQYLSDQ